MIDFLMLSYLDNHPNVKYLMRNDHGLTCSIERLTDKTLQDITDTLIDKYDIPPSDLTAIEGDGYYILTIKASDVAPDEVERWFNIA